MKGSNALRSVQFKRFLSFGPEAERFKLEPLNVLIGPNGSGKSNFIEAFGVIRTLPTDLTLPFRNGGGISQWIWNGYGTPDRFAFSIETTPNIIAPINHDFEIYFPERRPYLTIEEIYDRKGPLFHGDEGAWSLFVRNPPGSKEGVEKIPYEVESDILSNSVLSQIKDPSRYGRLARLSKIYSAIRIYRDWEFGRTAPCRQPQPTDLLNDFLDEDARNLALILNELEHQVAIKDKVVKYLKRFNPNIEDYIVKVVSGTVQLFLRETGLQNTVSAFRLSEGTLRFLSLLSVLCHPHPPQIICIEEPETGLHPDVMPVLAELLLEASSRAQIIVTTHSEALVSALSETPEAVIVCERDENGTKLRRLDSEQLSEWLQEYSLGDLWAKGVIGGTI